MSSHPYYLSRKSHCKTHQGIVLPILSGKATDTCQVFPKMFVCICLPDTRSLHQPAQQFLLVPARASGIRHASQYAVKWERLLHPHPP